MKDKSSNELTDAFSKTPEGYPLIAFSCGIFSSMVANCIVAVVCAVLISTFGYFYGEAIPGGLLTCAGLVVAVFVFTCRSRKWILLERAIPDDDLDADSPRHPAPPFMCVRTCMLGFVYKEERVGRDIAVDWLLADSVCRSHLGDSGVVSSQHFAVIALRCRGRRPMVIGTLADRKEMDHIAQELSRLTGLPIKKISHVQWQRLRKKSG
jgi:hypothetical protein